MDHIHRADWFGWCTPEGLAGPDERVRSINWVAQNVHSELLAIAGRGGLPMTIGNFINLSRETTRAAELDDAQPTAQFRNTSELIAEALRFVQVAAGKSVDILRAQRHGTAAAPTGSRSGGQGAWSSHTAAAGSGASSSWSAPTAMRRQRSAPHNARQRSEPPKASKRSNSSSRYRPEARR